MRTYLIGAGALILAAPALADNPHTPAPEGPTGAVAASFEQSSGFDLDMGSSVKGSSASGVQFETELGQGAAIAAFGSFGAAGSTTTATPFSVSTTSAHAAGFVAGTYGAAEMTASGQTFGQSEGKGHFDLDVSAFQSASFEGFVGF
jgi:hypothetical protein